MKKNFAKRILAALVICMMLASGMNLISAAAEVELDETLVLAEEEFTVKFANGEAAVYEAMDAESEQIAAYEDGTALLVKPINDNWSEVKPCGYILNVALRDTQEEAEEPVIDEPIVEEPVVEEPVVEEPAVEEPVVEEPIVEEPVVEEPIVEEPVVEEPIVEEPVVEEPIVEEPVAEEPIVEEPIVEEPVVEEPIVEEPIVEEPVVEEPIVEEPFVEEPVVEEPVVEEPVVEEPVVEEPAFEEPAEEPADEGFLVQDDEFEVQDVNDEEILIFNEYETPLGIAEQEAETVVYEFERDENGELILDEKGNPIAIVPEGAEIPVSYLRNENGELVLDENGNPIVTQTVPADAVIVNTLEDALNPNRTIDIYYSWNNEEPALGGEVTFIAVLYGYDNLEYTIQWQQSADDVNWYDIADANDTHYVETITRENYRDYWRVQVTITGVLNG